MLQRSSPCGAFESKVIRWGIPTFISCKNIRNLPQLALNPTYLTFNLDAVMLNVDFCSYFANIFGIYLDTISALAGGCALT